MYKCYHCGAIFYETAQNEDEACLVPSPFGMGKVRMGGGKFDCCPECKSEHYDDLYFDGMHCPYCAEIINLDSIEDIDNCEIACARCKTKFLIEDGEVTDAHQE